jgi:Flp pilus assembly protein TadB
MSRFLSFAVITALLLPLAACDKPSEQKAQEATQHTEKAQEHQEKAAVAESPALKQDHAQDAHDQKQKAAEDQQEANAALANESAVGVIAPDKASRAKEE